MALLESKGLTVRYGGLAANADVDLKVEVGQLVGLIGPNGAGKTTFIDAITDLLKVRRPAAEWQRQVDDALAVMGLTELANMLPSDLSHGQRKLVGVARALAAKPKLLLLDEPAAGLDTAESQLLGAHLRDFLKTGTSIFLIDHDMGLVLNVCDYIYVLDFGRIIAEGTPAQVRTDPAVVAAYLGESAGEMQAQAATTLSAARQAETAAAGEGE